jgi:undecaprenyl diphosphate synthase
MITNPQSSTSLQHIAIIMDGNGRWAQKRMMPRTVGHATGASRVKDLVKACSERGVKYLTIFAFSTENWGRPDEEVSTLMGLFIKYLDKEIADMSKQGVRLKVLGDTTRFPAELQERIQRVEASTANNEVITLNVAANYGGRWDIIQAIQRWQQEHPSQSINELNPDEVNNYLTTAGMPEPDLLIRTGGESRISNFLLWQCAYTEFYFTDVLWPDFTVQHLHEAMEWFGSRQRRFGKVLS